MHLRPRGDSNRRGSRACGRDQRRGFVKHVRAAVPRLPSASRSRRPRRSSPSMRPARRRAELSAALMVSLTGAIVSVAYALDAEAAYYGAAFAVAGAVFAVGGRAWSPSWLDDGRARHGSAPAHSRSPGWRSSRAYRDEAARGRGRPSGSGGVLCAGGDVPAQRADARPVARRAGGRASTRDDWMAVRRRAGSDARIPALPQQPAGRRDHRRHAPSRVSDDGGERWRSRRLGSSRAGCGRSSACTSTSCRSPRRSSR